MLTPGALLRPARAVYGAVRARFQAGLSYLPLARARHRALQRSAERSDQHTYTCFYRSRHQLEALVGPIADALELRGKHSVTLVVFAASDGAEAYTLASELLHRRPRLDFTVLASDLHEHTVRKAAAATYTADEVTKSGAPGEFIDRTFDRAQDHWVVKPHIRARVSFEQADLLEKSLPRQFPRAELVFAQNVFCHLAPPRARQAFENVVRVLKRGGWLFLDGMDLDLRVELTRARRLQPLDYKVKDIYQDARRHVPSNWWDYYYGSEPYLPFSRGRLRRYCTIFEAAAA